MKVIAHTEVKMIKAGRGFTMYSTVTFQDNSKKRLMKRVKENDFLKFKRMWEEMFTKGLNPMDQDDQKTYLKISGKISVSEVIQEYLSNSSIAESSKRAYRSKLNVIESLYGEELIENITTHQLNNLLRDKVNQGLYTQKTLLDATRIIKGLFNYAYEAKYIKTSPAISISNTIKSDKDANERNNPFEDEDFKVIMDRIKSLSNQSLYYFSCFIYHGCLRPEEIRNLKVRDINFKTKKITVKSSVAKNNLKQDIPIYSPLMSVLQKMEIDNADKNDYLFSHNCVANTSPYYGKNYVGDYFFGRWFRKELKNIDLYEDKGYSIYCFKHKSCVDKLNSGYKVAEISRLCRHSNVDVTLQYLAKISKVTPIDHLDSVEI